MTKQSTWIDRLRGSLPGGAKGAGRLVARLRRIGRPASTRLASTLLRDHCRGVRPEDWQRLTGIAGASRAVIDREMRLVIDAIVEAGLHDGYIEWMGVGMDPAELIGRWMWNERWLISGEDEDLLFFEARNVPLLLEAARDPSAPKRSYAHDIVTHFTRDRANHAVLRPGDPDTLSALTREHAAWARLARATDAPEVATYLARLASYGRARAFSEAEALQAFIDLSRCGANTAEGVRMIADDGGWTGLVPGAAARASRVRIDAGTGIVSRRR